MNVARATGDTNSAKEEQKKRKVFHPEQNIKIKIVLNRIFVLFANVMAINESNNFASLEDMLVPYYVPPSHRLNV